MSAVTLRYVDVQVTEPQFAGDPNPPTPVDPPARVVLRPDEKIAAITEFRQTSGTLGHDVAVHARVWIARRVSYP